MMLVNVFGCVDTCAFKLGVQHSLFLNRGPRPKKWKQPDHIVGSPGEASVPTWQLLIPETTKATVGVTQESVNLPYPK